MKQLFVLSLTAFPLMACDAGHSSDTYPAGVEMDFPQMDATTRNEIDSDADGEITENELQAARDDGII